MRNALLHELLEAGEDVLMPLDARLPLPVAHPCLRIQEMDGDSESSWDVWRRLLMDCDFAWNIAPETNGDLLRLTRLAEGAGVKLFGSSSAAVELCSGKRRLLACLGAAGIPCVQTCSLARTPTEGMDDWVIKPDCGAGCEMTWRVARGSLLEWQDKLRHQGDIWSVQPYLPGQSASLSILATGGEVVVVACNRQDVQLGTGSEMIFKGVEVNAYPELRGMFADLAKRIVAAIPGLTGLLGVDIVITRRDPMEFQVLEVNARPTITLSGLARSLGQPLGLLWMRAIETGTVLDIAALDSAPVWVSAYDE
ncbi:MAG: ATP-grasp domain-containing protein [Candidatus Eutrophobiaceae bacterium]